MKIRLFVAEVFKRTDTGRRTERDRHEDANCHFLQFYERALKTSLLILCTEINVVLLWE